jgi:multiple sugar transport system substrate-binding protein
MSAEAKTKLRFSHLWWSKGNEKVFGDKIKEFEKLNPDVEVEYYYTPFEQYRNVLVTRLVAGDAPDIVHYSDETIGDWVQMGAFRNLRELVSKELIDSYVPSALKNVDINGNLIGLSIGHAPDHLGFYYRVDIFKQKGITPPPPGENWTWVEAVQVAQKLTDPSKDQWGWVARCNLPFTFQKGLNWILWMNDGGIVEKVANDPAPLGQWISGFKNPKTVEAYKFYLDLWHKYQVRPKELVNMPSLGVEEGFVKGRFPMVEWGQHFSKVVLLNKYPELKFGVHWDIMPLPGPNHKKILPVHDHFWGITRQSKNPEVAAKLLTFMLGDKDYVRQQSEVDYNFTPPLKVWHNSPVYKNDPFHGKLLKLYDRVVYFPLAPKYGAIMDGIVGPVTQEAIQGQITPDQAIKEMDKRINDLLKY